MIEKERERGRLKSWGGERCSRGEQRVLDPWDLELQVLVSRVIWVLGIEPGFICRTGNSLNQ